MLNVNSSPTGTTSLDSESWVKLGRTITLPNHTKTREISSSLGDWNCAPNTLGLAVIDLIKQNHQFKDETLLTIIQNIRVGLGLLRQRLIRERNQASEYGNNAHVDLANALQRFISFINTNGNLTPKQFTDYIKQQNTKAEIAALLIGLAPALRVLGAEAYRLNLQAEGIDDEGIHTEIPQLSQNGVSAGQEILSHLARDVLEINLVVYEERIIDDNEQIIEVLTPDVLIANAPTCTIFNRSEHWTYLIPTEQSQGLAACLSENIPTVSATLSSSNTEKTSAANSSAGFFSGSAAQHDRVVTGKWTTKTEQVLLNKDAKRELIRKANDLLINAMDNGYIADKDNVLQQNQFVALFDSLEKAIHSSSSTNELLSKCKEFLSEKKSSAIDGNVINSLTKFIDNEVEAGQNQRSPIPTMSA